MVVDSDENCPECGAQLRTVKSSSRYFEVQIFRCPECDYSRTEPDMDTFDTLKEENVPDQVKERIGRMLGGTNTEKG